MANPHIQNPFVLFPPERLLCQIMNSHLLACQPRAIHSIGHHSTLSSLGRQSSKWSKKGEMRGPKKRKEIRKKTGNLRSQENVRIHPYLPGHSGSIGPHPVGVSKNRSRAHRLPACQLCSYQEALVACPEVPRKPSNYCLAAVLPGVDEVDRAKSGPSYEWQTPLPHAKCDVHCTGG